ncbi:MAG: alpha/beta hydrolase family protein [Bryobacteraceae bacterium]
MNRRTFLAAGAALPLLNAASHDSTRPDTVLAGTNALAEAGDLAMRMVENINDYALRITAESISNRAALWKRNYDSPEAYERSVAANREHLREIIGAVDPRLPITSLEFDTTTSTSALLSSNMRYKAFSVRWQVFPDVTAEGLLLEPARQAVARVVAIPDADQSPEMLAGLESGPDSASQFARSLAENGCQVVIPIVINRSDTWSGIPGIRMTNQPHREWIYRMAFEAGRHIIGYEVQKVLSAVDWFTHENSAGAVPIAVIGYGEGGLLALYSAATDVRIESAVVSGYFESRQELWKEPIYRDVWGLLREFGDAELASLISPRALVVEACHGPEISGPPTETPDRKGAAPSGRLTTPALDDVRREAERARMFYQNLRADENFHLVVSGDGKGSPGSEEALNALFRTLKLNVTLASPELAPEKVSHAIDGSERMHRQFNQLVAQTQAILRESPARRTEFWSKADSSSPARWQQTTASYRDYIWKEVIGQLPAPSIPANPRTRLIYDEPKFRGYEVLLDVWPGVFAYGILLQPKNLRPGERRPVVVCQHGLEGRPQDVADPKIDSHFYHHFAARLADEGFVTYAPQNPYIGQDRFRIIQRKAHPVKLSLFSFIIGQHQRTLEWLVTLPFVDSQRIGFYGLSYGGKTAVRVPPLLNDYALSICSGDFNEWVWKTTSADSSYSYMLTQEYDMLEFDFANVVSYSDLADLMAPRPFMVERGHLDTVAPDEWVAYEYAKVRRFYDVNMQLPNRSAIEFFTGPHTIHAQGTFEFLRQHLRWPPTTS